METRKILIGMMALLLIFHVSAQPVETTTIIIQLDQTGSALWIVERRFVLETEEDETLFEEFQADETFKNAELSDFKEKMNVLLEKAKYSSQRSMSVTDFDILLGKETTVTRTYGVIKFQFRWNGFARCEGTELSMGDVFEGGYYLSVNEILMVEFPESYHLKTVTPLPDQQRENVLTWEGPLNFASGEPALIIEGEPVHQLGKEELLPIIGGLASGCILVVVVIMKRKKRKKEKPEKRRIKPYLDDKELIINIIRDHGGAVSQKELPQLTGFSKAKVSILLNELKEKKRIRKTFRGRENLITLIE